MSAGIINLGSLSIDAVQYGSQGNAVLGIRDSGKTYTATFMAEHLFDAGIPFIAFDPIGVWRFLRVPGAQRGGRGYPVVVAGGQEGDLPLTVNGAPEIVRAAMHNGVSLVIDLFDIKLSKADWRRIVTACVRVLLHENQKHGLRHVFLEEAAEFIPQRPIDWDVYAEIEKLARMGGNARLGYTLVNQRSQEVSKAILELCENVFLHRQRGKNALENMDKWLAIAGAGEQKAIIASLPELPQGQCWAWVGGDKPRPPVLVEVPRKSSLHPDRRVMRGDQDVKAKGAVDVGQFVTGMKTTLVKVEEEAKANDPKLLRAEIARLTRQMTEAAAVAAKSGHAPDPKVIEETERKGYERGFAEGAQATKAAIMPHAEAVSEAAHELRMTVLPAPNFKPSPQRTPASPRPVEKREFQQKRTFSAKPQHPVPTGDITRPQQRVLNSLLFWRSIGHGAPSREQVGAVAGYSPSSGGFNNLIGGLRTAGHLDIPQAGHVSLVNGAAGDPMTTDEARNMLLSVLSAPQRKIIGAMKGTEALSRDDVGARAEYSPSSGGFNNLIGSLCTLGIMTKPLAGHVALSDWAAELLT